MIRSIFLKLEPNQIVIKPFTTNWSINLYITKKLITELVMYDKKSHYQIGDPLNRLPYFKIGDAQKPHLNW